MPKQFVTIPCNGKIPLVPWKEYTERRPTQEEVDRWETQYPKSDRGIITGPISNLIVLDDDGSDALKSYKIPHTVSVKTPRGGRHHYFSWVPDLDNKITTKVGVLEKVDVRGEGGFVRFYGWEKKPPFVPFARPPQWLIDLLPTKTESSLKESALGIQGGVGLNPIFPTKLSDLINGIKEGNRNASFTSWAGSLRARGYKPEEIFDSLKAKAKEVGFSEKELYIVCQSVGRYEPKYQNESNNTFSLGSFLSDRKEVEWLCKPMISRGSISFVAGLPKVSKTWAVMDLAIEMARGGLWLGRFPVKKAKVLLVDQERPKAETQRRLGAMLEAKGLLPDALDGFLSVRCNTTTRIDLQQSFEAFKKVLADEKPDLVIVDSFATWHTREESNRMEIQSVMEATKALRNEFGCAFLFIHHETKSAFQQAREGKEASYLDMSGNVAISAAAEHIFNIRRQDADSCFVYHTANNLGECVPPFLIKVIDVNPEKTKIKVEAY